jgi:hypothetical protein
MLLLLLKSNFDQIKFLLQPPLFYTQKQKLYRAIYLTILFGIMILKIKAKSTHLYNAINKWIQKQCKNRTFGELFGCSEPTFKNTVEYTVWDDHAFYDNYYTWNLCSI